MKEHTDELFKSLLRVMPSGWHSLVHASSVGGDLEKLLSVALKLPRFSGGGSDPYSWIRRGRNIPGVQSTKHLRNLLEKVLALLQTDCEPQNRKLDVEMAYWETVLWDELETLHSSLTHNSEDRKRVITIEEQAEHLATHPTNDETKVQLRELGDGLNQRGVLSAFGYHVGQIAKSKGLYKSHRRNALRSVLCENLQMLNGVSLKWWGEPATVRRGRAITAALGTFCRWNRGMDDAGYGNYRLAISDYESDIETMQKEWNLWSK